MAERSGFRRQIGCAAGDLARFQTSAPSNTVDVSKAVGHAYPDQTVTYNTRDLILYALGIGIKDLRYTYELDKQFAAFPTYALVLPLKGDHQDVNSYAKMTANAFDIPGLPKIDLNKLVHGDQSYELLAPLPKQGGKFTLKGKMIGVYDAGKGMITESETTMVDSKGTPLVRMTSSAFVIGAGNFNGPKRPRGINIPIPQRAPDHTQVTPILPTQALLYRLSGDYNPLHADPSIGKRLGMSGAFLHGLCTLGISSAAVLQAVGGNDVSRFRSVRGRFASPVYMGESVETRMWVVDGKGTEEVKREQGDVVVAFEAWVKDRVVIAGGVVVLKREGSKL
ncbi:hypothetical protein HK101_000804 [Irineochytrium annulatum]|nr:hypothetical protein HK101_000804 [Irineochytrium annulatum]